MYKTYIQHRAYWRSVNIRRKDICKHIDDQVHAPYIYGNGTNDFQKRKEGAVYINLSKRFELGIPTNYLNFIAPSHWRHVNIMASQITGN